MSCCCKKILDLCRVTSCLGKLSLGIQAPVTGKYAMVVDFLGTEYNIQKDFIQGQNLEFPIDSLNERYVFIGRVFKPDGTLVTKTIQDVVYECFSFETIFSYNVDGNVESDGKTFTVPASSFNEQGQYFSDQLQNIKAVYYTGIPNFLTKGTQWDFIIVNGVITGVQLFVGLDPEGIVYLFTNIINLS